MMAGSVGLPHDDALQQLPQGYARAVPGSGKMGNIKCPPYQGPLAQEGHLLHLNVVLGTDWIRTAADCCCSRRT